MLRWYEGVGNCHRVFYFFHHSSPPTDVPVFPRSLILHTTFIRWTIPSVIGEINSLRVTLSQGSLFPS